MVKKPFKGIDLQEKYSSLVFLKFPGFFQDIFIFFLFFRTFPDLEIYFFIFQAFQVFQGFAQEP